MGMESRRGAFHSFPLLTRLSIARSTSANKQSAFIPFFSHFTLPVFTTSLALGVLEALRWPRPRSDPNGIFVVSTERRNELFREKKAMHTVKLSGKGRTILALGNRTRA